MDSKVLLERLVYDMEHCRYHLVVDYLADDVVVYTWHGVVYGKKNATNYLLDYRRYQHHNLIYNKWKQVLHCVDVDLKPFDKTFDSPTAVGFDDIEESNASKTLMRRSRVQGGVPEIARYHSSTGYDSQGYAHFERDGFIASHPHVTFFRVPVKQTIVLKDNEIVLLNLTKRRK